MRGPASEEQGEQNADENRSGEQGRDHGDDGIGFEPDRFEHFLGQGRSVAAGDEDGDYGLVEGVKEREQRADQDPGAQHG